MVSWFLGFLVSWFLGQALLSLTQRDIVSETKTPYLELVQHVFYIQVQQPSLCINSVSNGLTRNVSSGREAHHTGVRVECVTNRCNKLGWQPVVISLYWLNRIDNGDNACSVLRVTRPFLTEKFNRRCRTNISQRNKRRVPRINTCLIELGFCRISFKMLYLG